MLSNFINIKVPCLFSLWQEHDVHRCKHCQLQQRLKLFFSFSSSSLCSFTINCCCACRCIFACTRGCPSSLPASATDKTAASRPSPAPAIPAAGEAEVLDDYSAEDEFTSWFFASFPMYMTITVSAQNPAIYAGRVPFADCCLHVASPLFPSCVHCKQSSSHLAMDADAVMYI